MPNRVIHNIGETLEWGAKAIIFGGVGSLIVDNILRRVTYPIIQEGIKALGNIQVRTFLVLGSFPVATTIAVYHVAQKAVVHLKCDNQHQKLTNRIIIAISFLSGVGVVAASRFILSVPLIQAVFVSVTGATLTFLIPYLVNKLTRPSQKTLTPQEIEELIKKHIQENAPQPAPHQNVPPQQPQVVPPPLDNAQIEERPSKADQGMINEKKLPSTETNPTPPKQIQEDISNDHQDLSSPPPVPSRSEPKQENQEPPPLPPRPELSQDTSPPPKKETQPPPPLPSRSERPLLLQQPKPKPKPQPLLLPRPPRPLPTVPQERANKKPTIQSLKNLRTLIEEKPAKDSFDGISELMQEYSKKLEECSTWLKELETKASLSETNNPPPQKEFDAFLKKGVPKKDEITKILDRINLTLSSSEANEFTQELKNLVKLIAEKGLKEDSESILYKMRLHSRTFEDHTRRLEVLEKSMSLDHISLSSSFNDLKRLINPTLNDDIKVDIEVILRDLNKRTSLPETNTSALKPILEDLVRLINGTSSKEDDEKIEDILDIFENLYSDLEKRLKAIGKNHVSPLDQIKLRSLATQDQDSDSDSEWSETDY